MQTSTCSSNEEPPCSVLHLPADQMAAASASEAMFPCAVRVGDLPLF